MEYTCELCNFKTARAYDLKVHNQTVKHKRNVGIIELEKQTNEKNNKFQKNDKKIINVLPDSLPLSHHDIINQNISENIDDLTGNNQIIVNEKKPKKVYLCKYCNKTFNQYQGMWSHVKICKCKSLFDEHKLTQENMIKLTESNNKLTETVEELKTMIQSSLKTHTIVTPPPININMTDNSINTTNMSNVVKYVNQNYINAQPLEMLQSLQAKNLLMAQTTKEHSVEELMIYYYDKHTLDKFIGKIIKNEYRKNNPEIQQFWATDVSRLSFLVRRVMKENDKIWVNDKKGILVKKYVIIPILVEVKEMIDKYEKYCKHKLETECMTMKMDDLEKLGNSSISCEALSSDLGGETIHDLVLKYITPCFQLEN